MLAIARLKHELKLDMLHRQSREGALMVNFFDVCAAVPHDSGHTR